MLVFDFSVTPAKLSLLRPGGEADKIKNTAANVLLLGRMLPYPWCHLNYRQSLPVTLCALPVESTAAITSGARLPLLPRPAGSGGSSQVFIRASFSAQLPPACALCKRTLKPYFSRSTLFLPALYHGFLPVSTQQEHFCAVCSGCGAFCAQLRHNPYKTLPSHCNVKPCSAIRWARTSSMKWQSRW